MLNPDLRNVLKDKTSRYSLCIAVAKRAREITQDAFDKREIIIEKPVSLATQELLDEKYSVVEPEEIRGL